MELKVEEDRSTGCSNLGHHRWYPGRGAELQTNFETTDVGA
jgi:hypothetical protein